MEKNVANALQAAANEFLQLIKQVPDEDLNTTPESGGWTAGQVGEHILKSGGFILQALRSPEKETTRDPAEKVKPLADIFLNFDIKMKGPAFIEPTDDPKNKKVLMDALESTFSSVYTVATTTDLIKTCAGADMPGMGELTRLEWISFLEVHTRRHSRQLEKIKELIA